MAKQNTINLPKFRLLCSDLHVPRAHVIGYLEMLWEVAHIIGPVFVDSEEVEAAAEWQGDLGVFTDSCVRRKWLDRLEDGRLQIHDYQDHAPKWVKDRERLRELRKQQSDKKLQDTTGCDEARQEADKSDDSVATLSIKHKTLGTRHKTLSIEQGKEEGSPSASARASSLTDFPDIPSWYPDICTLLKEAHPHADIPKPGSAQERDWLKCLVACANKHGEKKVRDALTWVFKDEPQPDDSTAFTLRRNIKSLATLTNRWKSGLTKIVTAIEHYENRDAKKAKKQQAEEPELNMNGTHISSYLLKMAIPKRIKEYRRDNPNDPEDYMMRQVCTWQEYKEWAEEQQNKRAAAASVRQPGGVTRLGDVLNAAKVSS
jgi:hypothetical protein